MCFFLLCFLSHFHFWLLWTTSYCYIYNRCVCVYIRVYARIRKHDVCLNVRAEQFKLLLFLVFHSSYQVVYLLGSSTETEVRRMDSVLPSNLQNYNKKKLDNFLLFLVFWEYAWTWKSVRAGSIDIQIHFHHKWEWSLCSYRICIWRENKQFACQWKFVFHKITEKLNNYCYLRAHV